MRDPSPSCDELTSVGDDLVYLDNNATTRPTPSVIDAMRETLAHGWHNPSSVHRPGQAARQRVDRARSTVAHLLGAADREITFTSGGTESVNLAVRSALAADPSRTVLVTSRLEHSAMRELAEEIEERGEAEVVWIHHDRNGLVDLEALDELLRGRAASIALVSIMWANNETGVIQPIVEIGERCRAHGVRVHTDAVQWVGRMPTSVDELPVDMLSFSGHKLHGPKGVGGLWSRRGVRLRRQIIGGPQERDHRGGTENTVGIVGLGAAAQEATTWVEDEALRRECAARRDRLQEGLRSAVADSVVIGESAPRLWTTLNIAVPRLEAEAILLLLSERRVCASAGAACSSGSLDPSPVLLAMGVDPVVAHGAIRLSLSRETTDAEVDRALEVIPAVIARLRRSMPGP